MAVKEDMDICLNITGSNETSSKKHTPVNSNARIKRLKANVKIKQPFKKYQATESTKSLVVGAKKRIKQKNLAAIVANDVQKAKLANATPQVSILKKAKDDFKNLIKDKKKIKEKKVGFLQSKDDNSGKTTVEFTKPTKESTGKTILAKKRKIDDGAPKKTLSNIFKSNSSDKSKTDETNLSGTKLLKQQIDTDKDNTVNDNNIQKVELPKSKTNNGPQFNKFKKSRDKIEKNKNSQTDFKGTNAHNRPSGKISSLFGNNPLVPNIGQRFVKPVNEKVFSAEKFSDLAIHPYSVSNLEQNMKITTMTTVQKKAIPVILSGEDVLIRSQTGSGKTLAYALPIIEKLQSITPKLSRSCGTKALVIVPTRELALQTYECFLKLIKPFTWIVPGYLIGGEKRKAEKARLRKGCTVLVATPGRLLDHIKHTKALNLDGIKYFVLDEADRMLDMGYEKDVSQIVTALENNPSEFNNYGYDALQLLKQNMQCSQGEKQKKENNEEEEEDLNEEKNSNLVYDSSNDNKGYNPLGMLKKHMKSNSNNQSKKPNEKNKKVVKRNDDDSDGEDNTIGESDNCDSDGDSDNKSELNSSKSIKKSEDSKEKSHPENSNDGEKKRNTILLSATLTHAVEKLAGLTMKNPVFIDAAKDNIETAGGNVSDINEDLIVPQSVVQSYVVTPPKLRMVTLSALIAGKCQSQGNHKILIFMATQDMIDYHAEILSSVLNNPIDENDEDSDPLVDVEFLKLHGSMTQKERTEIFKSFRQAKSGVLLCTDVAARGLDLPKVDTVIQYTGPTSLRDYVHRIGRTARAGSSGSAVVFLTPPEIEFVRMLEARRVRIKQDDMDDVLGKLLVPLSKHGSVQAAAVALQNDFENLVLENKKFYAMACKAYTSWVRFYSSYPREMRDAFSRKDLHLGHYAKSFALRDPPQKIGGVGKTMREKEEAQLTRPKHQNRLSNQRYDEASKMRGQAGGAQHQGHKQQQQQQQQRRLQDNKSMLRKVRMLNTSEYGSGLEPIKKPKKT